MNRWLAISCCLIILIAAGSYGQTETTPPLFLKEQEIKLKDTNGEVYLGKVMTLSVKS